MQLMELCGAPVDLIVSSPFPWLAVRLVPPHHQLEALPPPLAYDPHQYIRTLDQSFQENNNNNNCVDEKEQQGRSRYDLRQRKTQRVEESRGGDHKCRHRLRRSDELILITKVVTILLLL